MSQLTPSLLRGTPSLSPTVYARGEDYVLYQGDAVELLGGFEPETFDLIFADPPYFLSNGGFTCQSGKRAPVAKGKWDSSRGVEEDHRFTRQWLAACKRVLKPSGTIWVSGTQHVIFNAGFAMQRLGFKLLNTITWFKPNASPNLSCRYFTHSTEILIWASPGGKGKLRHTFNYQAMKQTNGGKQMRDVWAIASPEASNLRDDGQGQIWSLLTPRKAEKAQGRHPTQKPIALLNRIIEASAGEDAVVLDPFCGSGTTGVAAIGQGCRFVGMDLNALYLETARKRLDATKD